MVTRSEAILLLGVAPDADEAAVRAAFRKKVREQHPDTADTATDHSSLRRLIDAYRLLVDSGSQTGRPGATNHPVPVKYSSAERNNTSSTSRGRCLQCRGFGFCVVLRMCPECRGQGLLTTLDVYRMSYARCPRCRGSGHIRSADQCKTCHGTGLNFPSHSQKGRSDDFEPPK